jgi:hypothetical protein
MAWMGGVHVLYILTCSYFFNTASHVRMYENYDKKKKHHPHHQSATAERWLGLRRGAWRQHLLLALQG